MSNPSGDVQISIHASHAGCDMPVELLSCRCRQFQSTHPMRDATRLGLRLEQYQIDFNPRIPCGMRQQSARHSFLLTNFNPRIPCGMRRANYILHLLNILFQSTHPMRDATFPSAAQLVSFAISIHASHAGCDLVASIASVKTFHLFQSTHPMRDATCP